MENKEISLKELFNVIWKGKWIIILSAGVIGILGIIGGMIYDTTSSQVTTIVTMQWNGAAKGEYPDGTSFDYSDTIETYVITNAITEAGLELTTSDVVQALNLMPIVPGDVAALIQAALEDGEQMTYYASDYRMTLDNGSLGITVDEASQLMNKIISEYKLDFETKYIRQTIILDYSGADYDSVDYVDIAEILDTQVGLIESSIGQAYEEYPTFVSPTLGIGFNDILVRSELVNTIEIDQIKSRTNTFLLSKDEEYLITKYKYDIEIKTFAMETLILQEAQAQDLVDNYTGSTQTIIIPGLSENQEILVDTYYDTLLENLITLQNTIAEYEKDIEYLELKVLRLEGNDPLYSVTPQQQEDERLLVESSIISADSKLEDIVEDGNTILTEYNDYLTSNIIKPLMSPQYQSNVSVMMIAAVSLVLGAGIGAVVVLFRHEW
jgi:hypothetical protein